MMTVSSRTDIPSYLFAHEWWAGNYTIALTHLSIVHSLLHTLEQTLPLDRYIFEGAIFDDVMICLESGTGLHLTSPRPRRRRSGLNSKI
jgi:hypothetical protein